MNRYLDYITFVSFDGKLYVSQNDREKATELCLVQLDFDVLTALNYRDTCYVLTYDPNGDVILIKFNLDKHIRISVPYVMSKIKTNGRKLDWTLKQTYAKEPTGQETSEGKEIMMMPLFKIILIVSAENFMLFFKDEPRETKLPLYTGMVVFPDRIKRTDFYHFDENHVLLENGSMTQYKESGTVDVLPDLPRRDVCVYSEGSLVGLTFDGQSIFQLEHGRPYDPVAEIQGNIKKCFRMEISYQINGYFWIV